MEITNPGPSSASPLDENDAPLSGGPIVPVPHHLRPLLAPARWIVQEWREYWYIDHGAAHVQVGLQQVAAAPPGSGNYRIQFENQLGLTAIRAINTTGQTIAIHHVEVVAGKFRTPDESIEFLQKTLTALFSHVATAPYVLDASTERLVQEAPAPPSVLFAFHFFRRHGPELIRAVQAVLGRPHQRLDADPQLVRPHEVRQIDRESMIRMLHAGRYAGRAPAEGGVALTPLQRLRPERVWQHIPVETYDTPENRFVLEIARRMLTSLTAMTRQGWYERDVSATSRARIGDARAALAMLTMDDRFAPLGPMVVTPLQSRVLQQRDGYRDLALLWQRFQRSWEPLFAQMQAAIDLRSVDQLYELWVLFELIVEITGITGETPVLTPEVDQFGTPTRGYRARFGNAGTLQYNRTVSTYSALPLRPDYLWETLGGQMVAMDAKFRLRRPAMLLQNEARDREQVETNAPARATTEDLVKMHAYRDALPGVRAAVVLYPGAVSVFRTLDKRKHVLTLGNILDGDWEGVGAIAMAPHGVTILDDDLESPNVGPIMVDGN